MDTGDSGTDRETQLRSCLAEATRILDELPTPWVIVGALAAERYRASPRSTTDADLLVAWHPDLSSALERAGFELRVSRDEDEVHLIRARRPDGAIDLIVAGTDYQRLAIERGAQSVLTIEDVLIHKVIAWRPKDRDDIRSILEAGHAFDREYVEQWTREWGFDDRWREAQSWR
jgi:hypothetical protein